MHVLFEAFKFSIGLLLFALSYQPKKCQNGNVKGFVLKNKTGVVALLHSRFFEYKEQITLCYDKVLFLVRRRRTEFVFESQKVELVVIARGYGNMWVSKIICRGDVSAMLG